MILTAMPLGEIPGISQPLIVAADTLGVADPTELERSTLQRRFDRKFLLPLSEAPALLRRLATHYRVVLAGAARFAKYDTHYFDTPQLTCYHDHRRRRRPRCKVRVRHYLDRALSVLEVKRKTARGDTDKHRWAHEYGNSELTPSDVQKLRDTAPRLFVTSPEGDDAGLHRVARTVFSRVTLVSAHSVERATLDFEIVLEHQQNRRQIPFVVVEVKDSGHGASSPLVCALRSANARVRSFSKYSIAVALAGTERLTTLRPMVALVNRGQL